MQNSYIKSLNISDPAVKRLREIAAELSVSHESIHTILNDCLDMKRVAARLVLKDLKIPENAFKKCFMIGLFVRISILFGRGLL